MTRILFLPNDTAFYTLDSILTPEKLIAAVNSGRWLPPGEIMPSDPAAPTPIGMHAVRLGQNTVLIFRSIELNHVKAKQPTDGLLSSRQIAVLQCLAQGMTTRQIAARLGISRRTVYLHLAAIRSRMRAISTAEAVNHAAELGLCQPLVSGIPRKDTQDFTKS